MSTNPWLAVDVTTSPKTRARVLRGIWDQFLTDGQLDAVRLPIAESWQRSRAAGLDPTASRAPTLFGDRDEVAERWEAHPLEAAEPLIREWLGSVADESEHLIVVSDADGLLLWPASGVTTWADAVRIVLLESTVHLLDVFDALGRAPDVPAAALRETAHLLADLADPVAFVEAATGRSSSSLLPVLR